MNGSNNRNGLLSRTTVGALALTLGAGVFATHMATASSPKTPTGNTITVQSKGFKVTAPEDLAAGYIKVRYVNNGGIWSGFSLAKLNKGARVTDVVRAMKHQNDGYLRKLVSLYGGAGQQSGEALVAYLQPGTYLIEDSETGQKGKVMVATHTLNVHAAPAGGSLEPSMPAQATVTMLNFKYLQPAVLPRGFDTLAFANRSTEIHMWVLFKLNPGKTQQDVIAYLKSQQGSQSSPPSAPPPGQFYGGLEDMSPGNSAWLQLTLVPGNYVAMCFDLDPKTHQPHVALGMIKSFSVR